MAGPPGLSCCSGGGGPFVGAASGYRLADACGYLPKGCRVLQGQMQRTRAQRSSAPDCAERTGDEREDSVRDTRPPGTEQVADELRAG